MDTKNQAAKTLPIRFKSTLYMIDKWTILPLPDSASKQLPSRGQVMVKGTIDGHPLEKVLEPDGKWGHWFKVDEKLQKTLGIHAGDTVQLEITPSKDWPEPNIPRDF